MKTFKYTPLNAHVDVLENHYNKMFQCLTVVSANFGDLLSCLKPKMTSWYSAGNCMLLSFGEIRKSIFFVSKGMVVAFYLDHTGTKVAHTLFVDGEMAILQDSLKVEKPAMFCLMACPNTHLIEIPTDDLVQAAFPNADSLIQTMLSHQDYKVLERDLLRQYFGEERIRAFFDRFLMVLRFGRSNIIDQDVIASYLGIKKEYLGRLLGQIRKKEAEAEKRTGIKGRIRWTK